MFTQLEVCIYHVEEVSSGCLLRTCWSLVDTDWTYTLLSPGKSAFTPSRCLLFSESTKDSKHWIYNTSVYFKWKWWKGFLCYLYRLLSATLYLGRISSLYFIYKQTFTVVSNGLRKKKNHPLSFVYIKGAWLALPNSPDIFREVSQQEV